MNTPLKVILAASAFFATCGAVSSAVGGTPQAQAPQPSPTAAPAAVATVRPAIATPTATPAPACFRRLSITGYGVSATWVIQPLGDHPEITCLAADVSAPYTPGEASIPLSGVPSGYHRQCTTSVAGSDVVVWVDFKPIDVTNARAFCAA